MADSIRKIVVQLLNKHGDQTSVEFILTKTKKKILGLLDKITEQQIEIIDSTNLSVEDFMEEIDDLREFRAEKMAVVILMERFARFSSYESIVQFNSKLYNLIVTTRWLWRSEKKIIRDCRKYKGGQPKRNMVRARA